MVFCTIISFFSVLRCSNKRLLINFQILLSFGLACTAFCDINDAHRIFSLSVHLDNIAS
jgi:hypothetical protein